MVGVFTHKIYVQCDVPYKPFVHGYIGQWMPYNFATEGFHTTKHYSRLSLKKSTFIWEMAIVRFWAPMGGEGAYRQHMMLILGSLESM